MYGFFWNYLFYNCPINCTKHTNQYVKSQKNATFVSKTAKNPAKFYFEPNFIWSKGGKFSSAKYFVIQSGL